MITNIDKFDVICNTVDNGIILIDKNLKVKFWNRWLEIRTGISAKDIINKNLKDFYPKIDDKKLIRKITTALKLNSSTFYTPQISKFLLDIELSKVADNVFNEMQQSVTITPYDIENELVIIYIYDLNLNHKFLKKTQVKPMETIITRDDESSFFALVNIKTTTKSQKIKVLTIVDISDIKRKEALLLEQTKLAAMGEMIGNIAHQWRQPLNIISVAASGAKLKKEMDLLTDDSLMDILKLISETTVHLSNTIDVFKEFLKEDKERSLFNLSQNIQNNISLIDSVLNKNCIKIDLNLDDNIYVYNFANEFSQALINILQNASETLNLKVKENELRVIKIITKQLEDSVSIEIIDNAGGINSEILNKIFEPYFTTKHKFQGTGLGLYMTRKIIQESMKGKISVSNDNFTFENQKCFGALFKIILKNNT